MKLVRWMRFSWDLKQLPPDGPALPEHYQVRAMENGEQDTVFNVVQSAFSMETSYGDLLRAVRAPLQAHLDNHAGRSDLVTIVLCHGRRIIAASAASGDAEADSHLLTGPCVLMEYRNRGLGSALLYATLKALKELGLEKVHASAKENSLASKFIYPKFGASFSEPESDPVPLESAPRTRSTVSPAAPGSGGRNPGAAAQPLHLKRDRAPLAKKTPRPQSNLKK